MPDVPKNAKQPADHKAKAEATDAPFKIEWEQPAPTEDDPDATETTVFEIDREVGNDYEVLEMFADLDAEHDEGRQVLIITRILRQLLGRAEHERLKEACRVGGRVNPDRMFEFFNRMDDALGNHQASSGS